MRNLSSGINSIAQRNHIVSVLMKLSHQTLFKLQQYKPGYTAPRQLFHYTGISMNFGYFCSSCFGILLSSSAQCRNLTENHYLCWKHPSSDWGIEGLDLRNPYFLTWGDADDDHDLYSFHSPTSLICCRLIALLVCFFSLCSWEHVYRKFCFEHNDLFIFRVQFVLLLFLRHSLPVLLGGVDDFSITLLMVSSISNCTNIHISSLFLI